MPTGYTAELYDRDQSFEEFVWRCARAFGALVTMRDEALDVVPDAPLSVSSRHVKAQDEARGRLRALEDMSPAQARVAAIRSNATERAERELARDAYVERRARFAAMRERVVLWDPPHELVGLRRFMRDQLDKDLAERPRDFGEPPVPLNGEEWLNRERARVQRELQYRESALAAEEALVAERNAWIDALRQSVPPPVRATEGETA